MIYDMIIYIINYKITFIIKFYVPVNFKLILSFLRLNEFESTRNEKLNIQKY